MQIALKITWKIQSNPLNIFDTNRIELLLIRFDRNSIKSYQIELIR
jgi:hypothetical protein